MPSQIGSREAVTRGLVAFSGSETAIDLMFRLMRLPSEPAQTTFRFTAAIAVPAFRGPEIGAEGAAAA